LISPFDAFVVHTRYEYALSKHPHHHCEMMVGLDLLWNDFHIADASAIPIEGTTIGGELLSILERIKLHQIAPNGPNQSIGVKFSNDGDKHDILL